MNAIKLMLPPAAQTENSIALVWEKPVVSNDIAYYRVYIDNNLHGFSYASDYTVEPLAAGKEYKFFIDAVGMDGNILYRSNVVNGSTKKAPNTFDITSFGAVGDGVTMNTEAIQAAIDACTHGGMVYVPEGMFLTGALFIKSDMTLFIEKGATLLGSEAPNDYPLFHYLWEGRNVLCYASLINTKDTENQKLQNIVIQGQGVIDANGTKLFKAEMDENSGARGRAVCIRNADNVYLKDITIRNSPAWCVHLIYCNHTTINQVKVHTKYDEFGNRYPHIYNGDGIDPDGCNNMYIFHSLIASGDDCIAIKSGRDDEGRRAGIPSQNIRITNCHFKSGFGVAIGSEMSGGVRNVFIQDCSFEDVRGIATIKAPRGRGAFIENISYSDCTLKNIDTEYDDCKWFRGAINIDQFYSHEQYDVNKKEAVSECTPTIKDVFFRNIVLDTKAGRSIFMAGLPESPLVNISMENIHVIGKTGIEAYNINNLTLKNVFVHASEGEILKTENVSYTGEFEIINSNPSLSKHL